jgi:flagellar biosynthesis protein FlhB
VADSAAARREEPTPRRLAEARRQGQVPVSSELTGWVALAVVFALLVFAAGGGVGQLVVYVRAALAAAPRAGGAAPALAAGARQALALLALPLGLAFVVTVVAGMAQTGGLMTLLPLRPDPRRTTPALRRVLNAASLAAAGKGLANALVLGALASLTARLVLRPLVALSGAPPGRVLGAIGALGAVLGWRLVSAGAGLGLLDLLWQRWRHRRGLRMTRAEVERERRQHDGDPRHRTERQRVHRALEHQDVAAVRQAALVVTGPSMLVALRLDGDRAPVVVARGERLVAAGLGAAARRAGVPAFSDPELTAALFAVPVGTHIPESLYAPVAEIVKVILQPSHHPTRGPA